MRVHVFAAALAAALASMSCVSAVAETINYSAKLTGAAETPPNDSKGTGTLTATFDTASRTFTWSADYADLTGPVTAAHFHGPAPVGKPAPVEVPQPAPFESPLKGSVTLTDEQAKDLTDGLIYFNIHTAEHKPGEIRGQVEKAM